MTAVRPARGRPPHCARDVLGLYVPNVVGLALVVLGWWAASGDAVLSRQVGWMSVAVLGFTVAGVGDLMFFALGRRALIMRRARLLGVPDRGSAAVDRAFLAQMAGDGPVRSSGRDAPVLVSGRRMTAFHRERCPMAAGKDVEAATRDSHERAGRKPCPVCKP